MNIEKLDLANLVGEMMDEIMKLQIFFTFLKCLPPNVPVILLYHLCQSSVILMLEKKCRWRCH